MNSFERKLLRKRQGLLAQITELSLLLNASYLERFSTCVRPQCECHKGKKHGPRAYLSVYREQQQRQVYVPQPQRDTVQLGLRQYQRLQEIVKAITDINLQLMRAGRLSETREQTTKGGKRHE